MGPKEEFSRKKELGQFLRSRRERMPLSLDRSLNRSRRRTPGMRREEVAEAAGVGVSWYTWLEQGRDIMVSQEILRRICRALQLDPDETRHVFRLAGRTSPEEAEGTTTGVKPSLQNVLNALEHVPAYVHNARWDRIAWNDASLALMGDFSKDPPEERNTIWRTFLNPAVREYSADWDHLARIIVAEFNASLGRQFDEPWLKEFIDRLGALSPEFLALWNQREVLPRREERTRINHKGVGQLHLERSIFQVPYEPGLSMVIFTPLPDEDTPEKLRRMVKEFKAAKQS